MQTGKTDTAAENIFSDRRELAKTASRLLHGREFNRKIQGSAQGAALSLEMPNQIGQHSDSEPYKES
jgi:hypothetical protein